MILRHAAMALVGLSLITGPVQALDLNDMSDAEKAEFGTQVREYLLQNPEVILEAINILEQRNAAAEAVADQIEVCGKLSMDYTFTLTAARTLFVEFKANDGTKFKGFIMTVCVDP